MNINVKTLAVSAGLLLGTIILFIVAFAGFMAGNSSDLSADLNACWCYTYLDLSGTRNMACKTVVYGNDYPENLKDNFKRDLSQVRQTKSRVLYGFTVNYETDTFNKDRVGWADRTGFDGVVLYLPSYYYSDSDDVRKNIRELVDYAVELELQVYLEYTNMWSNSDMEEAFFEQVDGIYIDGLTTSDDIDRAYINSSLPADDVVSEYEIEILAGSSNSGNLIEIEGLMYKCEYE